MACLTSIPMVSAFAAALLCCAEPMAGVAGAPRTAWPARSFQTLAVLALLEAWAVGYGGAHLTQTSICSQISLDILDHSSQLLPSYFPATFQSLPSVLGDFLLHHWRISAIHPCLGLAHCCGGVFQPVSGGLEPAEPAIRVGHGGHCPCEPLGGGQAL